MPRCDVLTFDCYGALVDWERGIAEAVEAAARAAGLALDRRAVLAADHDIEPAVEAKVFPSYREVLTETAWRLFGNGPTGWGRVQAICDYVHRHIVFGYEHARMTRSALEALHDRTGVCRDYTHLAIALCRCMNIPARYCTGYLGDIGMPLPHGTPDFAAWFEVFLGGRWHTFDARNNMPRIGRGLDM